MNKITYENFNNKAHTYSQTRATYSNNYINIFCSELSKQPDAIIADIAAGTGINTKIISAYSKKIFAIEPNVDMLNECQHYCSNKNNIEYLRNKAECTGLVSHSIDLITIAQAFQLLDLEKTREECQRILKDNGKVILVWNSKETKNGFFYDTEKILLQFCPLYKRELHVINFQPNTFNDFFRKPPEFYRFIDDGPHYLTKNDYIGRALCASYSITSQDKNYNMYIEALSEVFEKYAANGLVYAPLSTVVYVGGI